MDPPDGNRDSPRVSTLSMTPRIFPDEKTLGWELAHRIIEGVSAAAKARRAYLLGCPGGRSLLPTYRSLSQLAASHSTDLSPLRIVMMDDYVTWTGNDFVHVPSDAHYSCRRFAIEEIAAPLQAIAGAPGRDRIWLPDPTDPAAYDRLLAESGGIDLFLLASGASDGHIAFNPAGSSRYSTTRIVELATETRTDNMATFPEFDSLSQVPTHGVTVGVGTIADQSRSAVMVCLGSEKSPTVRRITAARSYDPSWPATIITEIPNAELWIDLPASS